MANMSPAGFRGSSLARAHRAGVRYILAHAHNDYLTNYWNETSNAVIYLQDLPCSTHVIHQSLGSAYNYHKRQNRQRNGVDIS